MSALALSRILNLRPNEGPRVALLYVKILIFATISTWSGATLEAAFLAQVGVAGLSWFAITKGIVSLGAIAVYSAFADRISNQRLFIAILSVGVAAIGFGVITLALGWPQWAYPWLYLVFFIPLDDIIAAHWFTYMSGFYDAQAAKRVIPVLGTGGSLAAIGAGFSLPLLNAWMPPITIILVWMLGLLVIAILTAAMPRILREPAPPPPRRTLARNESAAASTGLRGVLTSWREGTGFVLGSAFLRWMMAATLFTLTLLTLLQYQVGQILLTNLNDSARIANFLGLVTSVVNLIALPIQLFVLSRVIERIGLGNANLIFPVGMFGISGALLAFPALAGAALGHFARTRFYAIGYTIENLLYNAVPLSVRGRARAFINGLVAPLGLLVGGLLLLVAQQIDLAWFVPSLIVLTALGYLLCALVVRHYYGQALLDLLARDDFSYLLSGDAGRMNIADPATVRALRQRLSAGASNEVTIFLARLLSEVGSNEDLALLGQFGQTHAAPNVRAAIIGLLVVSGSRDPAIPALCLSRLSDTDADVRLAAINGLINLDLRSRQNLTHLLEPCLDDPDLRVQASVLPIFLRDTTRPAHNECVARLTALEQSTQINEQVLGIEVIVATESPALLPRLLPPLQAPADELRLAAALALETVSLRGVPADMLPPLRDLLPNLAHDHVERVRQAAVVLLGRVDPTSPLLPQALIDPDQPVRDTAIATLAQLGTPLIPVLETLRNGSDQLHAAMATITLVKMRRKQFALLIEPQIEQCLAAISQQNHEHDLLAPFANLPGGAMLAALRREQAEQWRTTLFALLAALHPPEHVRLISTGLRSPDPLTRANATEALETLLPPYLAHHVAAQSVPPEPEATPVPSLESATLIEDLLKPSSDSWQRALTIWLLGGLGARLEAPDATPPAQLTPDTWLNQPATMRTRIESFSHDADPMLTQTAHAALRVITPPAPDTAPWPMTLVEKVALLRTTAFFAGLTLNQLRMLAPVCEEEFHAQDSYVFHAGDMGDSLYIIVTGRIGLEQERRPGSPARIATLGPASIFGEIGMLIQGQRSASALALQPTHTLLVRRAPLLALVRQHPELSLTLINALSAMLRETQDQIAELTHVRTKKVDQLFEQLGSS